MFLLHGEIATTCGLFIPIIVLRVHLRVFEAVAVSAMMHTPEGRIDRNSPIRKRDCRNVDPLCM